MGEDSRKYEFSWDVINSNMEAARPRLGAATTVEMYRLFQFTLRDVLEVRYGAKAVDDVFRDAGTLAGTAFFKQYCSEAPDLAALTKLLQEKFQTLGVGIIRFEITDVEKMTFQLTVDEDLDCSGLPDTADQICIYDEGFIKTRDSSKGFSIRSPAGTFR